MQNKAFSKIGAFIILIILIGVGYFGWQYIQEPKEEIKTPEQTIKDETADWKTFKSTEYGYGVKYPNEWEIYKEGFSEEYSRALELVLKYQNDLVKIEKRPLSIEFQKELEEYQGKTILENLTLKEKRWLNSLKEIEEYQDKIIIEKRDLNSLGVESVKEERIIIDGRNFNRLCTTVEILEGKEQSICIVVGFSEEVFTFQCYSEGDGCNSVFSQILSTFRFIEPEIISEEEAINLVKNLSEVKEWLSLFTGPGDTSPTTGGKPMMVVDNKSEQGYSIHVYEQLSDHTATFNWYSVDSKTGEIDPVF